MQIEFGKIFPCFLIPKLVENRHAVNVEQDKGSGWVNEPVMRLLASDKRIFALTRIVVRKMNNFLCLEFIIVMG